MKNSRIITSILLVLILTLSIVPASLLTVSAETTYQLDAYNTDSRGIKYTLDLFDKTAEVSGTASTYNKNVIIPNNVTKDSITYTVTSIGEYTFMNTSITSVIISNSVITIKNCTIAYCMSLTSVIIPDSVAFIGSSAFEGCINLNNVNIPENVKEIGAWSFWDTAWMDNQTDEFVIVGDGVFIKYNGDQTDLIVPEGVKYISNFLHFRDLEIRTITLPIGVNIIGDSAFLNFKWLDNINIPDSVTSIKESAFCGCISLTSVVIPDSVTFIGEYAFCECTSLISVVIPDSITTIENGVFCGCSSLTSVVIPSSVVSIGYYAFAECENLVKVIIPRSVTTIDTSVFTSSPVTFYIYEESYAHAYAVDNMIDYVLIKDAIGSLGAKVNTQINGLRFGAEYNKNDFRPPVENIGVILYPTARLGEDTLDLDYAAETPNVVVVRAIGISADDYVQGQAFSDYDFFVFYATLISIPESQLSTNITAVPFVKYSDGSVFYGEPMVRNFNQVLGTTASKEGDNTFTPPTVWWD